MHKVINKQQERKKKKKQEEEKNKKKKTNVDNKTQNDQNGFQSVSFTHCHDIVARFSFHEFVRLADKTSTFDCV